jgi:hypothetical protein
LTGTLLRPVCFQTANPIVEAGEVLSTHTRLMKKNSTKTRPAASPAKSRSRENSSGLIHPVIIYPYRQPADYSDLEHLYELVARLNSDRKTYAQPITVVDRKTAITMKGNKAFEAFRTNTVGKHSEIIEAWCVDTCQMWYTGIGAAFDRGGPDDVYWVIPGDFNYGSSVGREVLGRLHDLPEICIELDQDICIGEIATDHNNSKQLIDTYGTFALLYHWFPQEAMEIRQYTERPRSELFAIRHNFLQEVLRHRWYAYEQTVVILLQCIFSNRRISRFFVGNISDLPSGKENYAAAVQQVERTERVLKTMWRERHQQKAGWIDQYHRLEAQSEQILQTAFAILRNVLA